MAPPLSDPLNGDVARRRNKSAPFKFLLPLIYAPVLPLIRISLRRWPVLRDRVFVAVLAGAVLHGGYLVLADFFYWSSLTLDGRVLPTDLYDAESK